MKKRLLCLLLMLALVFGALAITVAAQSVAASADTALKAGYAIVDINPYWSTYSGTRKPATMKDGDMMPLPMAGYGDNSHRLSAPALLDDNGDGKISGPDGDGLHATVLAIQSGGSTVLIITVDTISFKSAMTKQVRNLITEATGIPGANIMINGTHTHGGVDLTATFKASGEPFQSADKATNYTAEECTAYLTHYKTFLVNQLTEGAKQAMADLCPATMEKGTIDAGIQNGGKTMNSVRHYVQKYTEKSGTVTYVRGSNFNNNVNGDSKYDSYYTNCYTGGDYEAWRDTHVSESDDALHLLRFRVEGKDDILLLNWRGHPASSNKTYTNASGKKVNIYQNLFSDYVGSIRYGLDSQGFRTTFILGASGNLGASSAFPWESWIEDNAKANKLPFAVEYGRTITATANALLTKTAANASGDPMKAIASGPVLTSQLKYKMPIQIPGALEIAACQAYQANAADLAAHDSYVYTDPDTGEKFVVASSYHANAVVNKKDYQQGASRSIELDVITVGNELSFIAMPYEASDRYSMKATLTTANNYNDWDLLANVGTFGTPFVMTCSNDHIGYIPNHLAYNYNKDSVHYGKYAAASYEAQTSPATDGEGEKLMLVYKDMLEQMYTKTQYCDHCKQTVTWLPLNTGVISSNDHCIPAGHYFLAKDLTYTYKQVSLTEGQVCLDLNGYTYSVAHPTDASRAVNMSGGATLNIFDTSKEQTGKMMGRGVLVETASSFSCGTLNISTGCTANLYSGTLTQDHTEGYHASNGGVVRVAGTFNMYGGTVTGGIASINGGGNIYLTEKGAFNMHGGTVSNGQAGTYGGNVYVGTTARFTMSDGKITGGTAETGPSVYVAYASSNKHSVQLTGTTQGTAPVQITFASTLGNMLQINGTYTGILELSPSGSVFENMNIAKCGENTDIGGATITVVGMGDLSPAVSGNYIKLTKRLGWMQLSGKWYYFYEANKAQTGWFQDEGDWHYFDETGVMQTGWLKLGEDRYFLDEEGHRVTGTVIAEGTLNRFDESGLWQNVLTGWNTLADKQYYADENGVLAAGFATVGDKVYYFGEDYAMQTGWLELDGKKYYLLEDGVMATGWLELKDGWYYFDAQGVMANSTGFVNGALSRFDENGLWLGYAAGWQQLEGNWYYTDAQGKPSIGWKLINGVYYFFNGSGVMQTGWLQSGTTWYYLRASGAMATGWENVSGIYYYFAASGAMVTGWVQSGNAWYYMNSSGAMVTGWLKLGSTYYYLNASGAMATGWVQSGNAWYYMNSSGAMVTGWKQISGIWYYFQSGGAMQTGWKQISGVWYYFQSGGAMQTGWLKLGGTWYYFYSSGAMATGSVKIGNKTYTFNSSGACLNP